MKRVARFVFLVLAVSGAFALLAGCSIVKGPGARALPATGGLFLPARSLDTIGGTAPDVTGVDVVTGQPITLSQFEGRTVVLNFVNYGCNPSIDRSVSAQLLAMREAYRERADFVPFSVFCGCCPPEVLKQFAQDNALDWPWILDLDGSIVAEYSALIGEFGYPTLVFVDKDQTITEITGAVSPADLNAKLDKIAGIGGVAGGGT